MSQQKLQEQIVSEIINSGITQESLGAYLGITRQSIAKIARGEYVKLPIKGKERLEQLINRNIEEVSHLIELDRLQTEIFERMMKGDENYLNKAIQGFNYMHYWITNPKFNDQPKYHEMYFGHMNNFYPRFNQIALFMRDTLNRQKYPLLTYQVDYKNKQITSFNLKAFVPEYERSYYSTDAINFPISFQEFIDHLKKIVVPSPRFLLYKDYLDDDWQFILDNVKKNQWIHQEEFYDLSRLFNFFENEENYYGPLLEDALRNFRIDFDINKLFKDSSYRADKIIELINLTSLQKLHQKKRDKNDYLFDSHGFKRNNQFVKNERRKLKKGNY